MICGGVTIGFAAIKLSGSPKKFGAKITSENRSVNKTTKPNISLIL
jgi:hypothetical protein